MEPGFREQALGLLKAQGFDDAEIITTDTHVVNAISLSSRGYPPIGRNKPDETLEHIVAASVKARERIQPVKVGLGFGKANGLRTFGEKGFDILTQDVAEAAGIAKKVGIRAGGGSILLYILLAFLI
jgi:putative membrane protein